MKLGCEIVSVETRGDNFHVRMKGMIVTAAEWRENAEQSIVVPNTPTTRRAYHVGRKVMLDASLGAS